MPKYRFSCEHCTREWWSWMGMNDDPPEVCPHCYKPKPQKVPTVFFSKEQQKPEKKVAGELVEEAIVEAKQDFEKQKEEMRKMDDVHA